MHKAHDGAAFAVAARHSTAANDHHLLAQLRGFTMLLSFIIAALRAPRTYVWKPAVTLTDSRVVSELTGTSY